MGTSKVHDLVKNLINQAEFISDFGLIYFSFKVGLADGDEGIEELDGKGSIDVGFGSG